MGAKLLLREERPPVTVVSVLWESDDSILVAADSGVTEVDGLSIMKSSTDKKLQSHPSGELAWAITGNASIGDRLTDWMMSYRWPPDNLDTFTDDVSAKVAELNGHRRRNLELARLKEKPDDTATILLVACLDSLYVVVIDDSGNFTRYRRAEYPFYAIGSGGPHARLIDAAYRAIHLSIIPIVQRMNIVMGLASIKEQQCSPPINIWRVSKQGITKDLSAELQQPTRLETESPA